VTNRKTVIVIGVVLAALFLGLHAYSSTQVGLAGQQSAPPDITARGVSIEQSRRMRAKEFAWDHEIQIALPSSYHRSNKAYPVLWVTDGSLQFQAAIEAVNVTEKGHLPEMIVVGIGAPPEALAETWVRRDYDFTPTTADQGFEVSAAVN
jgi:predicted alpha/beta superfamily hydrolase